MPADKSTRKAKPVVKADKDVMLQRVEPGARKEDWIGSQLRRVYDDALNEEIPSDMLALLGQLDKASDEDAAPNDDAANDDGSEGRS